MNKIHIIIGLSICTLAAKAQFNNVSTGIETDPNTVTAVKSYAPVTILGDKPTLKLTEIANDSSNTFHNISVDDNTSEIEYLFGSKTFTSAKNEKVIFRSSKRPNIYRSERLLDVFTITADGKVGVRTSNPTKKFQVEGESYFTDQVNIGSDSTGSHALAVEGSIGARKVIAEATGWSDFVFAEDYQLSDIEDVASFISANKHLPEVPSEQEVLENGIDAVEMDALLLQKIEELTLYLLDMNVKVEALEIENGILRAAH